MSWDEIKLANAATKKKMEESVASKTPDKAKLPNRIEKPKQGIAKMAKIASTCTVTVDGKKTDLKEIIAFEVISYGRWQTHIVATATPVKLEPILKLLQSNVPEESWKQSGKLPTPYVRLVLDDMDQPQNLQLYADKVPGIGSTPELDGNALVEDGRARGKYTLRSGKFFDHTYSAEISFDTPLITSNSTPTKRLASAPKLENVGKIVLGSKTFPLANVVVYRMKEGEKVVTYVQLTEKPIDKDKLQSALKKAKGLDDLPLSFQTQIKLSFDANDELQSVFLWCDGVSLNWSGNDNIKSQMQSEDGRVRGTVHTLVSEDSFGKKCDFQASFDSMMIQVAK